MPKRRKNYRQKSPIAVSVIAAAIVVLFLIRLYQVFEPLIRQEVFRNGIHAPLFADWRLTSLVSALLSSLTYLVLSAAGLVVLIVYGVKILSIARNRS